MNSHGSLHAVPQVASLTPESSAMKQALCHGHRDSQIQLLEELYTSRPIPSLTDCLRELYSSTVPGAAWPACSSSHVIARPGASVGRLERPLTLPGSPAFARHPEDCMGEFERVPDGAMSPSKGALGRRARLDARRPLVGPWC